ncbi:heavy metal translocating P-type ATPase [Rhodohalobacter mucosus]|uniref:Cadmium-translocating P-type ATPase n=1 Tax=Rhodohalobacter mucosus TaxID=2079485 RepID=A0A316TPY6_9BACT|nr:heavy metal translocating P-type ATPase [Rhodohalobacter mucosus]PWN05731.1 cadmium-translocating P-type ATPase [Rhodohalobacter mucosus]
MSCCSHKQIQNGETNDALNEYRGWFTAASTGGLILGALAQFTSLLPGFLAVPFFIISYIGGGYFGIIETAKSLRSFQLNIDFLMIAAAAGAAFLGEWMEGAILLFLFSLSGTLESYALGKSRNAIKSLMELRPNEGLIRLPDGTETQVPVEEMKPGDIVIVKPGEYIPIDGKVIKGQSAVNQSAITGESIPVPKERGDTVFAATLNENGVIEIEVTKSVRDTTLAKIISLVETAQQNRAKTQHFLDSFEPRYAVTVVFSVLLLIFIPWLIMGHDFDSTFYRAITVLVVASPCALIISTPASIISAIANGARNGILFKGGAYVEQTVTIDTIAFDKTGTLTIGEPAVTDLIPAPDGTVYPNQVTELENRLLAIAAGCEQYSEHHLAGAILREAEQRGIAPADVENMKSTPGQGVRASMNGSSVAVGNLTMFNSQISNESWSDELLANAHELRKNGKTVIFVAQDQKPLGLIALADQIRPSAHEVISQLKNQGIQNIVMLTGDNIGVANAIAEQLDIDRVYADLLPEEKVEKLKELKKEGIVAMVGDGVNDAPALATSHLGIAMGAAGTDVALETADVVLMGDDLTKLPYLISLSRKARKVVWQNIIFSLGVIVMLLAGVFLIDLPLTLGVVGHEGSTLIVVLNGLRLLKRDRHSADRHQPKKPRPAETPATDRLTAKAAL